MCLLCPRPSGSSTAFTLHLLYWLAGKPVSKDNLQLHSWVTEHKGAVSGLLERTLVTFRPGLYDGCDIHMGFWIGSLRKKVTLVLSMGGKGTGPESSQLTSMLLSSFCQPMWIKEDVKPWRHQVKVSRAWVPECLPGAQVFWWSHWTEWAVNFLEFVCYSVWQDVFSLIQGERTWIPFWMRCVRDAYDTLRQSIH